MPIDKGTAKVLIVKFNDYQCPPCRQTYNEYKGILSKYTPGGTVKYVVKHFPLELECNTMNAGHTAACEAAAAVIMAQKKGTAEKLEAWLFANQGPPHLTPNQVRQAAADVGGITDFDAQYPAVLNEVKADAALGARLGVKSTPTFFINGRRIAGGLPPAGFEAAIELELKRREVGEQEIRSFLCFLLISVDLVISCSTRSATPSSDRRATPGARAGNTRPARRAAASRRPQSSSPDRSGWSRTAGPGASA